jgi:hypothetical protein
MSTRKRAPGAGRKPKGEFANLASPFSLRMPPNLRKQLEQAVKRSGRSVSQEILRRVSNSLDRERNERWKPETRALCFLVARLEQVMSNEVDGHWRNNPYFHQAFKEAFNVLFDKMRPVGEIEMSARSPEEFGNIVADSVWNEMHAPLIDYDLLWSVLTSQGLSEAAYKSARDWRDKSETTQYGYKDVRRDLDLEPKKQRR